MAGCAEALDPQPGGRGGGLVLGLVIFLAIVGPWFAPHPYDELYFDYVAIPPNASRRPFLFGTDAVGRDLFVRTFMGARISLLVGVAATSVCLVIGDSLRRDRRDSSAGGSTADDAVCRYHVRPAVHVFRDHFDGGVRPQYHPDVPGLGAVEWLTMARIVRGQTLTLKNREFVEAAAPRA